MTTLISGLQVSFATEQDGVSLKLADAVGVPRATLRFGVPGEPVAGWDADDEDLALHSGEGFNARLRSVGDPESWTLQLTFDNTSASPLPLPELWCEVDADGPAWVAPGLRGSSLFLGDLPRPGEVLRLQSDASIRAAAPGLFGASTASVETEGGAEGAGAPGERPAGRGVRLLLSEPDAELRPFARWSVTLSARLGVHDPEDVFADLVVPAGTEMLLELPDVAVVPGEGVTCTQDDTDVRVTGEPGVREIALAGPMGVVRLPLVWAPPLADLLTPWVDAVVAEDPRRASDADAFLVSAAAARRIARDQEQTLDWLDGEDWIGRGTPLSLATAAGVAALQGDGSAFDQIWDALAALDVGFGYAQVVSHCWIASLTTLGLPDGRAQGLMERESEGEAALERLIVTNHPEAEAAAGVRRFIARLGWGLPGRPVGLSCADAGRIVSLLAILPETWEVAPEAAEAAQKGARMLVADAVAGRPESREGLAWLLLGDLGT